MAKTQTMRGMEEQAPVDEFGAGVPDEAPVEEVVEEPVAEQVEEAPQNVVVERLRSLGYDVPEDADDSAVLESLAEGWRTVQEVSPEVEEYRKVKDELAQWKAEKEKASKAPAKAPRPQMSEYAQRMVDAGLISVDPKTGLYASEDARLDPYVKEANEAHTWQRKRAQRLVEDPFEAIKEDGLEEYLKQRDAEVEKRVMAQIEARLSAMQTSSQLEKFWSEKLPEFAQKDSTGKVLYANGKPLLNEKGRAYQSAYKSAQEKYGIQDPVRAHELALELSAHVSSPKPKGKKFAETVNDIRGTNRLNGGRTVAAALSKQGDEDIDVETLWLEEAHKLR